MKNVSITLFTLFVLSAGVIWASGRTQTTRDTHPLDAVTIEATPVDVGSDDLGSNKFKISMFPQGVVQFGVECVAVPQCPDCTRGGNVCRGAREFYGGPLGAAVAKKMIIAKCQKANALDYCGGSMGCMKLSSQDQRRHRERNGGGCYPQCERVAKCVVQYRNP
ncbi:MAG: hypothetical protein ACREA9_21975 [Pyrinomonadaceae bacterium]